MQIFIKTVGGCTAQLAFIWSILHNNCWPDLHPPPELWKRFADKGVWSDRAWERSPCFCAGVMAFNPRQCFSAGCSRSALSSCVSGPSTASVPRGERRQKRLFAAFCCCAYPRSVPVVCLDAGACSFFSACSGNGPLGASTGWVVSVWPFRLVTRMPRIPFWYFSPFSKPLSVKGFVVFANQRCLDLPF